MHHSGGELQIPLDPQCWTREDVSQWVQYCASRPHTHHQTPPLHTPDPRCWTREDVGQWLQYCTSRPHTHTPDLPTHTSPDPSPTHTPDPRCWSREDVSQWLQYCASRYQLGVVHYDRFPMNGKGVLLMTKHMFVYRLPEGGGILYEDIQLRLQRVLRESLQLAVSKASPVSVY